jgi:hypothetical protein
MKAWARQRFNWDHSARLWMEIIDADLTSGNVIDPSEPLVSEIPGEWIVANTLL